MSRKAGVHGLRDFSGGGAGGGSHSDDEDDSPKGQSYYTGGTSSGLSVMDPRKGIEQVFKEGQVKDGGAKGACVIRLWKNGYTVDDGDLQDANSPEGQNFMRDLQAARIPKQLLARHAELQKRGFELDVSVEDHRGEDYVPPAYKAFSGSGATAGKSAPVAAAAVVRGPGVGAASITLDPGAPSTTLMVKLADGRREKVVLNLSHTVGDLQSKVASLKGTTKPFILMAGVPPKPLDVASATIEAAGLKSAVVTQVAQ